MATTEMEQKVIDRIESGLIYHNIPQYMWYGIKQHIIYGGPTGDFLYALFSNDFMEMARRADDTNINIFPNYARFLYNYAPTGCYGSEEKYKNWKGIVGITKQGE